MTVSESIINWLKNFQMDTGQAMGMINTDIQEKEEYTYSLIKEPVQNVKTYISGGKVFTDHYMLQARLPSYLNVERIENTAFGEQLEKWVREQDRIYNYPAIDGASVQMVGITTPFFMGQTKENNSIYTMTIAIRYFRGGKQA